MSFVVKKVQNAPGWVKGIFVIPAMIAGVMLIGLGLIIVGFLGFTALNFINEKILDLGPLGVTILQFLILWFRMGLFLFLGSLLLVVLFMAMLWNAVGGFLVEGVNWILGNVFEVLSQTKADQFGRISRVPLLGTYIPLEWTDAESETWIEDAIKIATFIKDLLLPDLPENFWDSASLDPSFSSLKHFYQLIRLRI